MLIYLTENELHTLSMFLGEKLVCTKFKIEHYEAEHKKHEASVYAKVYNTFSEIKAKVDKVEREASNG